MFEEVVRPFQTNTARREDGSYVLDAGHHLPAISPVCSTCKHHVYETPEPTCAAFPEGIPVRIWLGSTIMEHLTWAIIAFSLSLSFGRKSRTTLGPFSAEGPVVWLDPRIQIPVGEQHTSSVSRKPKPRLPENVQCLRTIPDSI